MLDKTETDKQLSSVSLVGSQNVYQTIIAFALYMSSILKPLYEPLSVNVKAEDRRAETMLTRSSLQMRDKVTQEEDKVTQQEAGSQAGPLSLDLTSGWIQPESDNYTT